MICIESLKKKASHIILVFLLLATGWGCSKRNGECSQTDVPPFQVLVTTHVLVTDLDLTPLEFQDGITIITELHDCSGDVEGRVEFKGSTGVNGVFSKNAGYTMDNKEDNIRVYAFYGNKEVEAEDWVSYDDTKGTQGQIHVQLQLIIP